MIWIRSCFIFLCSLYSLCSYAASWTPSPPGTISTTSEVEAGGDVFVSPIPTTDQYVATWSDNTTNQPTYSFYTQGMGWSPAASIFMTAQTRAIVTTAVNPATGEVIAAWADRSSGNPTYSIYTQGSGWSTPTTISTIAAIQVVFLSFDTATGQFLATWNRQSTIKPFYSFFTAGSWGTATAFPSVPTFVFVGPTTASDPATGNILAVWRDQTASANVYYSLYTPGPGWSAAASFSTPNIVAGQPFVSFDPVLGQFIATWNDTAGGLNFAFFTEGSGWGAPGLINNSTGLSDVVTSVNSHNGVILATWSNPDIAYSFFTPGSGWGPQGLIATSLNAVTDVYSAFNSNQFVATWPNSSGNTFPLYALYTLSSSPSHFKGTQKINDFGAVSERYNSLSWQKTPGVENYYLYRNGALIAVLSGNTDSYMDHNQSKHSETYSLVAVTGGTPSDPVTIVVSGK